MDLLCKLSPGRGGEENMKPGFLIYKCRRCNQEQKSLHVPNVLIALSRICSGSDLSKQWGPHIVRLNEIHACSDGGYGVTDLISGEEDRQKRRFHPEV